MKGCYDALLLHTYIYTSLYLPSHFRVAYVANISAEYLTIGREKDHHTGNYVNLLFLRKFLWSEGSLAFEKVHKGFYFHSWVLVLVDNSRPQSPRSFKPVKGSRAQAGPDFLRMRRVFVSYSQPIGFTRFDRKSVNRGLLVLNKVRALDPCQRPEKL